MRSVRANPSRHAPAAAGPQRIGSWILEQPIGAGKLAEVYEARPAGNPVRSPAAYAVKVLREEWHTEPRAVALFRREALVGSRLSHPHVVPVLAYDVDAPPYYLAMPRLAGQTLTSYLASKPRPVVPLALWFARQVAEGLDALHTKCGMMHADVKPSNTFVGNDGHAWLLDLGLASAAGHPRSLADRPLVGTLQYMAPEVITSSLAGDIRSDIYSLGVTLYEMLAGRPPFPTLDPSELALLHRDAAPPPVTDFAGESPPAVAELVHEMLAKEPLRRPQTPRDLVARLTRLELECFAQREPQRC